MNVEDKVNVLYPSNFNVQNPYTVLEVSSNECLLTNGVHTIWEYIDSLELIVE